MLKAIFTWLISRLFGGDKTAELAEAKGKLETQNAEQKSEIAATQSRDDIDDSVNNLSRDDVNKQLREYQSDFK
jgi:hypothetical protein